jgi:hypothetical protein
LKPTEYDYFKKQIKEAFGQTRFATDETADGTERMINPRQSEVRPAPDQKPLNIELGFLFPCA